LTVQPLSDDPQRLDVWQMLLDCLEVHRIAENKRNAMKWWGFIPGVAMILPVVRRHSKNGLKFQLIRDIENGSRI